MISLINDTNYTHVVIRQKGLNHERVSEFFLFLDYLSHSVNWNVLLSVKLSKAHYIYSNNMEGLSLEISVEEQETIRFNLLVLAAFGPFAKHLTVLTVFPLLQIHYSSERHRKRLLENEARKGISIVAVLSDIIFIITETFFNYSVRIMNYKDILPLTIRVLKSRGELSAMSACQPAVI